MPKDKSKQGVWFTVTNYGLDTAECYQKHKDQIRFVAFGEETCPTTGRKHHQVFCMLWKKCASLKKVANLFNSSHVEPMRGKISDNETYCSKEGVYTQLGNPPRPGARSDIAEAVAEIKKGTITPDEIMLEDPTMYHMYGRTLERAYVLFLRQKWRTEMTQGIWYWGPTGVGKSHAAFANYSPKTHFIKDLTVAWWDGYLQQENVIFNEFRGQVPFDQLLALVDKWPHNVAIRSKESVPFISKTLIVTSSKHPKDVYAKTCLDDEKLDQLERRFKIIHLE